MVVDFKNTNYFERTQVLNDYYNDIRKFDDTVDVEKEKELFNELNAIKAACDEISKKYKEETGINIPRHELDSRLISEYGINPDTEQKIKDKIINANQRFVVSVARVFADKDNLLDAINEGNIGLIEALNNYDSSKGTKFSSFAVYYIRRSINLFKMECGNVVKKKNISKTYYIIPKARNAFMQENHRQPTADELIAFIDDRFGFNIKDSADMLDINVASIDDNATDDDNVNAGNLNQYEIYSASQNLYEKIVDDEQNKLAVRKLLKFLTPREKIIITMCYGIGYDREYELKEIAEHIGITTERVRQMKKSIMEKLKKCKV